MIKSIAIVLSLALHSICLYSIFSFHNCFETLENPKNSHIFIYTPFITDTPNASKYLKKSQPQTSHLPHMQKKSLEMPLKKYIPKPQNHAKDIHEILATPISSPKKSTLTKKNLNHTLPKHRQNALVGDDAESKEITPTLSPPSASVHIPQNGFQGEYPYVSYKHREEGGVKLQFQWHDNGYPINIDLIQSSGFKALDQAAAEALYHPFPDLLAVLKENITYETTICFTLKSIEDETFN